MAPPWWAIVAILAALLAFGFLLYEGARYARSFAKAGKDVVDGILKLPTEKLRSWLLGHPYFDDLGKRGIPLRETDEGRRLLQLFQEGRYGELLADDQAAFNRLANQAAPSPGRPYWLEDFCIIVDVTA